MFNNFAVYLLLSGIVVDSVKGQSGEGSVCEWEGLANSIQGTCVNPKRCLTALDKQSPKHPECGDNLICCTDCTLVNDTSNAVIIPSAGVFWKTGQKAHDKCLEYMRDLPYSCNKYSHGGLLRTLDIDNECHNYGLWWRNRTASSSEPKMEFPYHARLTYQDGVRCSGTIISENFILAVPQCGDFTVENSIKTIELGIMNRWDDRSKWQILQAKRLIPHPEYVNISAYHYFGLVETKTPIVFNENVLPICLQVEDESPSELITTTWKDAKLENKDARKVWSFPMKKYGGHVCTEAYANTDSFTRGFDEVSQLCYGDEENRETACKAKSGEPVLVRNDKLGCVDKLTGVISYSSLCNDDGDGINVVSKISYYIPWIESIVWP